MKKGILIAIFLLPLFVSGQGLFEYFKLTADDDGPERFDRIAVDLNYDTWLGKPAGINTGYFSIGVNAYWFKDIPLDSNSHVSIAFGLGISSHNVHHNGQFLTTDSAGSSYTSLHPLPKGTTWNKNKYTATYFDIPFELRLRNMHIIPKRADKPHRSFRFYPGFKVGVLINDHTKWRDENIKYKVYDLKHVLKYRYGVTCRLAFNKFAISGFYSLSPLFEKGKGIEMYPVSIGFSWIRL